MNTLVIVLIAAVCLLCCMKTAKTLFPLMDGLYSVISSAPLQVTVL